MSRHTISLFVEVTDPAALYAAAAESYAAETKDADVPDWLGTPEEPDVGNCLRQLADPGVSWPGTEIYDSSASDDEEEE